MRVPRKPTPREGLAGRTQEKDLGPRPHGRGLDRPHLHESWDEGPREARALGRWGSRGRGSRKRVPTPQGAMRSWGVPQARLARAADRRPGRGPGGLHLGPLTHSLGLSELHSTPATDHMALIPAQQPGTSARAGALSPHRQPLSSGQCLQLALQHDAGVVGPEHPGRQAIHRVLQVPVQAGSLKVAGRVGLSTWLPWGQSHSAPPRPCPRLPGGMEPPVRWRALGLCVQEKVPASSHAHPPCQTSRWVTPSAPLTVSLSKSLSRGLCCP